MTTTVRREIVLAAPPEEVWPAITESARLSEWFGGDVELEPRPGGRLRVRWADATSRGVVEAVEPHRRLAFRWWHDDGRGEPEQTRVELCLDAVGAGTRVRVSESVTRTSAGLVTAAACLGAGWAWAGLLERLLGVVGAANAAR